MPTKEETLAIKAETRATDYRFHWYLSMFSGGTLILLFNLIKDLESVDPSSSTYLRVAIWLILASFILSPLRNFLSNLITGKLNLIGSDKDKDGGKSLIRLAKTLSFFRNIFALLSVTFYIIGLISAALAVDALFLS